MHHVDTAEIQQLLRAFLTEMKAWNDRCQAESSDESAGPPDFRSQRDRLAEIVARHCTPRDLSCASLHYGEPSAWDPAEQIDGIERRGDGEVHVITRCAGRMSSRYRYELLRSDDRWRIDGRYYLFEDDLAGREVQGARSVA
jgi:hypothetical protein